MYKLLLNNVKHIFIKTRLMALTLVFVQLFSVIVIVFSYGIINHYNYKIDEKESTTLIYDFLALDKENGGYGTVELDLVDKFIKKVLPYVEDKLDYFFIMGLADEYIIQCSSGYDEQGYKLSTQLAHRTGVVDGQKFNDEQMNSSKNIMIARKTDVDSNWCIKIGEETYKAVGLLPESYAENAIFVPYKAIPNDTKIYYISLLFTEPIYESEYNKIVSMVTGTFGDAFDIPEFMGIINESSNRVYRDIMFVTVFLILVCAVNYCILYRYILDKRRKEFAISRICGCSKYKVGIAYMVELVGVSAIILVVGLLIYHNFILSKAVKQFNYIALFYSKDIYMMIAGIYMGILSLMYVVLVWRFVNKTPALLVREV